MNYPRASQLLNKWNLFLRSTLSMRMPRLGAPNPTNCIPPQNLNQSHLVGNQYYNFNTVNVNVLLSCQIRLQRF